MKKNISGYKIGVLLTIIVVNLGALILRLPHLLRTGLCDFTVYYEGTQRLMAGINPYILSSTQTTRMPVSPGFAALFSPIIQLDLVSASFGLIVLDIIVLLILYGYLYTSFIGPLPIHNHSRWTSLVWLSVGLTFFLESAPTLFALRNGQASIIAGLFFCFSLLGRNTLWRSLALALGIIIKNSLFPILIIVLLLRKEFRLLGLAFIVVSMISFFPSLWGWDLVTLHRDYTSLAISTMSSHGWNTYPKSGGDLVNMGFFLNNPMNTLLKLLTLISLIAVIWTQPKGKKPTLLVTILIVATSLSIAYHRLYDLPFLFPLLLFQIIQPTPNHRRGFQFRWIQLFFIGGYLIPQSFILRASSIIGGVVKDNPYVLIIPQQYQSSFTHLIPLYGIITSLMVLYFSISYWINKKRAHKKWSGSSGTAEFRNDIIALTR